MPPVITGLRRNAEPVWRLLVLLPLMITACTTVTETEPCESCGAASQAIEVSALEPGPNPRRSAEARATAALQSLPEKALAQGAEGASLSEVRPFVAPTAPVTKPVTLSQAITRALADNPQVGLALARYDESAALKRASESALYPQVEANIAGGHALLGNYATAIGDYWDRKNAMGYARTEGTLSARQLLWNFGATSAEIEKAARSMDAQALQSVATAEDIAFSVAQVYLKVLQQRELIAIADENVTALKDISRLVEENERNGNATLADVKRARARVLDAQTVRADQDYELHLALDKFRRLARAEPGALRPPRLFAEAVPRSREAALAEAERANPAVLSLLAAIASAKRERDAVRLGAMPTLNLEASASGKDFQGNKNKSELDVRTVAAMRYKLMDGGLQSAQLDQASARLVQQEMKLRSQKEDLEADLRQFYWQLETTRGKRDSLAEGVDTSRKAKELYNEQFRGGKRSLLELLDIQNAYFTARRAQITNRFDEHLATYGIVKALGRFVRTAAGPKG